MGDNWNDFGYFCHIIVSSGTYWPKGILGAVSPFKVAVANTCMES